MFLPTALLVAFISVAGCLKDVKSPILFIPGLTGSRLNAQDSSGGPCDSNGESRNVWINGTLIQQQPECFSIQLMLNYSANYADAEGITITAVDFSDIAGLEFYSTGFLQYFVDRGYTANVDIQVASYDWRLAPEQLLSRGYYTNLKQLIQTMFEENGNKKVVVVIHSMGGPVSLYFLTRIVSQQWKDTYIHSYITLAGAWAGGNAIIDSLISGPFMTGFIESQVGVEEIRDLYRSWASYYLLLPSAAVWNDTVLVVTPSRNYTANDYRELFSDIGYPQGYNQFTEIDMEWPAPNVPTYCFYGLGVDTPMSFVYDNEFPNSQPTVVPGDGDDSVNRPSSEICLQWAQANNGYTFNSTILPHVNHTAILTDGSVLKVIGSIVGVPVDPISGALPQPKQQAFVYCVLMMVSVVFTFSLY